MQELVCDNRIGTEAAHRGKMHVFRGRPLLHAARVSANLPHAVRASGSCVTRLILVVAAYLIARPSGETGVRWNMQQR
jgi:hypothetical protein